MKRGESGLVSELTLTLRRSAPAATLLRALGWVACAALLALLAPFVAALAESQAVPKLTIVLDPPRPFAEAGDPAQWLVPAAAPAPQSGTPGFSPTLLVPGPAAQPFVLTGSAQDKLRASLCLTAALYYEAANEPDEGQRAVAQVILNRVRHPAYPKSICGVVYQGTERADTLCQFTFGCDGSLVRVPVTSVWTRAWRNAQAALGGAVYAPVGLATHYHTLAVNPVWNRSLTPTAIVGAHIFFRWPGGAGSPAAFRSAYVGNEPVPAPKPRASYVEAGFAGEPMKRFESDAPGEASSLPVMMPDVAVAADQQSQANRLPESGIKEAYRDSGTWKDARVVQR